MLLHFRFNYISTNDTYFYFLDKIVSSFTVNYRLYKDGDFLDLYVEEEQEVLQKFADTLSTSLPMSLFYYGLEIKHLDELPNIKSTKIEENLSFSFCPDCLSRVLRKDTKDYYNSFISCDICNKYDTGVYLLDKKERESQKILFEQVAKLIKSGKRVKIKTLSGDYIFSQLEDIAKSDELLCTNLEALATLVVADKNQIVALASFEKPTINFRVNQIYKSKNSITKHSIDIRYANDLSLFFLSLELKDLGIDFLDIKEDGEFDTLLDMKIDKKLKKIDIPKIVCFDNKKLFIKSNSYPKYLDDVYKKFEQKDKSQFMTVLSENRLFEKNVINFYISSKNSDGISLYSTKIDGLIDIVKPLHIPQSTKEIFDLIKADEVGNRLLLNYINKFEDDYNIALNSDISLYDKNSFYNYWQIAKIVLNFKEDILYSATKIAFDKGPRLDYKLKDSKEQFNFEFDYIKLIRSAMSFKLAGLSEDTIATGFVDSLVHFISKTVDDLHMEYDIEAVSLCGDMFGNEIFTNLIEKAITKNFKLYYNKEFIIQG